MKTIILWKRKRARTFKAHDGRVCAIGAQAVLAVAGASEACRHWDARLARDGRVRIADTCAIGPRSDGVSFVTTDAFGAGFKPREG